MQTLLIPQKSTHSLSDLSFFSFNSTGAAPQDIFGCIKPLARFLSAKSLSSPISLGAIVYILGLRNFAPGKFSIAQSKG